MLLEVKVPAEALAARYGCDAFTEYDMLLSRKDVDAVVICTPSGLHSELAVQAARAGKGRTEQSQADLPPEVIEEQRDIEPQGEPLLSTQEHDAEEAVDGVFWQHQLKRKQRRRPE